MSPVIKNPKSRHNTSKLGHNSGEGIALREQGDVAFWQNLHHGQIALVRECQQQNKWIKRWMLLGLLVALLAIGGGVVLLFVVYKNQHLESKLSYKLTNSQYDLLRQFQ